MSEKQETEPKGRRTEPQRHDVDELFEVGGREVVLKGTSGLAKEPPRVVEGRPIRHDIVVGGRTISAAGTSGASQVEARTASGRPLQHRPAAQDRAVAPTGSGNIIGGPIRRA